jgi:hypothetical protein
MKKTATDELVNRLTAFRGFGDMLASLRDGYIPTVRDTRTGWKLARIVLAHGFPVRQGGRVLGRN